MIIAHFPSLEASGLSRDVRGRELSALLDAKVNLPSAMARPGMRPCAHLFYRVM